MCHYHIICRVHRNQDLLIRPCAKKRQNKRCPRKTTEYAEPGLHRSCEKCAEVLIQNTSQFDTDKDPEDPLRIKSLWENDPQFSQEEVPRDEKEADLESLSPSSDMVLFEPNLSNDGNHDSPPSHLKNNTNQGDETNYGLFLTPAEDLIADGDPSSRQIPKMSSSSSSQSHPNQQGHTATEVPASAKEGQVALEGEAEDMVLTDAVETLRRTARVRKPSLKATDNQTIASGGSGRKRIGSTR